jgi:hypothetical protein
MLTSSHKTSVQLLPFPPSPSSIVLSAHESPNTTSRLPLDASPFPQAQSPVNPPASTPKAMRWSRVRTRALGSSKMMEKMEKTARQTHTTKRMCTLIARTRATGKADSSSSSNLASYDADDAAKDYGVQLDRLPRRLQGSHGANLTLRAASSTVGDILCR